MRKGRGGNLSGLGLVVEHCELMCGSGCDKLRPNECEWNRL